MKKVLLLVVLIVVGFAVVGCDTDKIISCCKVYKDRWESEKEWNNRVAKSLDGFQEEILRTKSLAKAEKWEIEHKYVAEIKLLKKQFEDDKLAIETKYLKANLVTPTPQWLELHGDSLTSYQIYNTNVLVQNATRQKTVISSQ